MTNKAFLAVVASVLVVVFVAGAAWYRNREAARAEDAMQANRDRLVRPYSPTDGAAGAEVTLVEFFDPECEACGAMYPIVKRLLAEFDGRVRLVIRYMPLHQNSAYAAALLEASRAQNRYWEFLDIVMARQAEWASHHAPRPDLLLTYAAQAGLDVDQLRITTTDPDIRARIQQDHADGMAVGANRTPTFFVNGRMLPQIGYGPLRAAIQAELR